jgi:hypothetical protein
MAYNITYTPSSWNPYLADELAFKSDVDVLRHALGFAYADMPTALNESHIVCLDFEWWEKDPKPTTEIGIAELFTEGQPPSAHAENILTDIQTAHARIMPHAHLLNNFPGAGNREVFHFGTTKLVTVEGPSKSSSTRSCALAMAEMERSSPLSSLAMLSE